MKVGGKRGGGEEEKRDIERTIRSKVDILITAATHTFLSRYNAWFHPPPPYGSLRR